MIINTVVKGAGGGGNQVSAYALSTAASSVAGDKVMLTPSALMFPGECSVSNTTVLVGSTSPKESSLYIDPRVATSYYAKRWLIKKNGVFTSKSVTSNWCYPIAVGLFRTYDGFYYTLNTDTAEFSKLGTTIGRDGGYGGAVNAAEDIVVCRYYNGPDRIGINRRTGYTWTSSSYTGYSYVIPVAAFRFKGVNYLSLWMKDADNKDVFSLTAADDPKTVLKTQGALAYHWDAHTRCLDDKYIVGCTGFSSTSVGYIYKIVEDDDGLPLLMYDSKNSSILTSIISVGNGSLYSSCFTVGDGYINLPNGRYKYDGVTLEKAQSLFPELNPTYLSQYISPVTGFAVGADPYTGKYGIIKTYTPLEQKWVACVPTIPTYYSDSLTGFVKENNSGILTVETVEDPNNPLPEYPDTYGLGYTASSGGEVSLNGVIVGSPTVTSDNVMSGFSTTNYLELPASVIPSGGEPWTFVTKFNCTSVSSEQGILGYRGYGLFRISINDSKLNLGLSTATSSWNVGTIIGSTTLSNNTDYWVKAEFTGSAYKLYLSTDGSIYNEEGTLATSGVPTWPTVLTYGIMSQLAFQGSLYAQEAYLEVDGERVWKGTKVNSGSIAINWGWYKSSGTYYKYSGGTATFDNVQGDKATTMNLYLASDAEGTVTPVITTSEPLGYVSSHLLGKVYLSDTLDYFVDAPV